MRRSLGWVALVLGFSLIALAPLQRFYVAEQLVGVPKDTYQKSTLEATQASYLDTASGQMRTGATLVATNTTRGNAKASNGDTTVLDSFTVLEDRTTGTRLEVQSHRAALNRKTSEIGNCCGAAVGNDTSVRQSGIAMSWPIADVEKKTYQFFDTTTKRTWPMNFEAVEDVQGTKAYKYVMHVQPTPIAQLDNVPGQLLGLDKKKTYTADRIYEAYVSTWVDPRTGSPVNRRQQVTTTLRTRDGGGSMTVASFDLKMTPDSQRALLQTSRDSAWTISAVRTIIPVGSLLTGIALLIAGLVLVRRGRAEGRRVQG